MAETESTQTFKLEETHSEFLEHFAKHVEKMELTDELASEIFTEMFEDEVKNFASAMTKQLVADAENLSVEQRVQEEAFKQRNVERWKGGFVKLRATITISTECVEATRRGLLADTEWTTSPRLFTLTNLHARSIRIANEISCLLENGYPDGALSRWRALHENAVVSTFLTHHGDDLSNRYLASRDCVAYKAACQYTTHQDKANLTPFAPTELEELQKLSDQAMSTYGSELKNEWGWAHGVLRATKPTFAQIEEHCGLDHWRPRVKWASQETHAGFVPIDVGLGVSESKEPGFLVGQSNSGMTEPASMTAVSLNLVTTNVLLLEPTLDRIAAAKVLDHFVHSVGEAFMEAGEKPSD